MKRVVIVHGYTGYPDKNWFPWLKERLEAQEVEVHVPQMPDTNEPKKDAWVAKLHEVVGEPDEDTFLVGHSLGCPAILRYLESFDTGKKVGGVVLVAGFAEDIGIEALDTFINEPFDFVSIQQAANSFVALSSDNDPYIELDVAKRMAQNTEAELIVESGAGHFNHKDGFTELPQALDILNRSMTI